MELTSPRADDERREPMASDSIDADSGGAISRWGVLGGTFDPIHYAHLAIAEHVRDRLGLTGVLFVPASQPPHKPDRIMSSAHDRAAMVELAIADNDRFRMSRIELERPGPSYTVDTMATLVRENPTIRYLFILSTEAVRGLKTWHDVDRLLDLCRFAVVPRGGEAPMGPEWIEAEFPGRRDRFVFIDGPKLHHSASYIRREVAAHRSIRYLVPPPVAAYLRDQRLYLDQGAGWPADAQTQEAML